LTRDRALALALHQSTEKPWKMASASGRNLLAGAGGLPIVAGAFDKKIFENESVFPAVERSAAADATHLGVNRR
jgi:hypothetical protein